MERIHDIYRDKDERVRDFKEVERLLPAEGPTATTAAPTTC